MSFDRKEAWQWLLKHGAFGKEHANGFRELRVVPLSVLSSQHGVDKFLKYVVLLSRSNNFVKINDEGLVLFREPNF